MKQTRSLVLLLASLLLPVAAVAAGPSVSVAPIPTISVARGGHAPLEIDLRVSAGFHINSHQPNGEFLIPTVVHLNAPTGLVILNIHYPEGEELALPFAEDKLSVYSGDFEVTAEVRALKSAPLGRQRVHGEVRYQACDNRQCFPPKTTPLEFDVRVVRHRARHSTTGRRLR